MDTDPDYVINAVLAEAWHLLDEFTWSGQPPI